MFQRRPWYKMTGVQVSFDEVVDNAVVVGKYLENIPENN